MPLNVVAAPMCQHCSVPTLVKAPVTKGTVSPPNYSFGKVLQAGALGTMLHPPPQVPAQKRCSIFAKRMKFENEQEKGLTQQRGWGRGQERALDPVMSLENGYELKSRRVRRGKEAPGHSIFSGSPESPYGADRRGGWRAVAAGDPETKALAATGRVATF